MTENLHVRPCEKDEPMNHDLRWQDWERRAQELGEAHLEACRAAYYHEDEHAPDVTCDECPPYVSDMPYDDCTTCTVRVVLDAAWPVLAEMAVAEYLSLPIDGIPPWRRSS